MNINVSNYYCVGCFIEICLRVKMSATVLGIGALCRGWRTNNTNTNATNAATAGDTNSLLLTTEKEGTLLQHATQTLPHLLLIPTTPIQMSESILPNDLK